MSDPGVSKEDYYPLSSIAEINPSFSKRVSNSSLVSFITMSDVKEVGGLNEFEDRFYYEVKSGFTRFVENDVIFAKITPCMENGKGALVKNLTNEVGFGSTEFHVLRANSDGCPEYIYQMTKDVCFRQLAEKNMTGSAGQRRVPTDFFRVHKVYIPEKEQQQKIAKILSTVDNLIEKTQSLIDKYTAIKQGMMADLFTRGIDLSGTPETNNNYGQLRPSVTDAPELYQETALGWVPKDWISNNLNEVSSSIGDGVHYSVKRVEEGVPFLFVSCIKHGEIQWKKAACISQLTYEEISKSSKPYEGLILFTAVGSYGQVAYVRDDRPFGFERNIAYIKPIQSIIMSRFLFYALHTRDIKDQVESLVMGNAQKLISLGNLGRININFPNVFEQEAVYKKLDMIDSKIELEINLNEKYQKIKKGLMQDLLTGKVIVGD